MPRWGVNFRPNKRRSAQPEMTYVFETETPEEAKARGFAYLRAEGHAGSYRFHAVVREAVNG